MLERRGVEGLHREKLHAYGDAGARGGISRAVQGNGPGAGGKVRGLRQRGGLSRAVHGTFPAGPGQLCRGHVHRARRERAGVQVLSLHLRVPQARPELRHRAHPPLLGGGPAKRDQRSIGRRRPPLLLAFGRGRDRREWQGHTLPQI